MNFLGNTFCNNHNGCNIICSLLKKEQEGGNRMCENNKGSHEPKEVENASLEGTALGETRPSRSGPRAKFIAHPCHK